jgi:hypothetical protein
MIGDVLIVLNLIINGYDTNSIELTMGFTY